MRVVLPGYTRDIVSAKLVVNNKTYPVTAEMKTIDVEATFPFTAKLETVYKDNKIANIERTFERYEVVRPETLNVRPMRPDNA